MGMGGGESIVPDDFLEILPEVSPEEDVKIEGNQKDVHEGEAAGRVAFLDRENKHALSL
jgi:hypothetical protein